MSQDQDKKVEHQKVAVVTGSSSGIGKEIAITLAKNNFLTYATMRDPKKGQDFKSQADKENLPLKIVELDVTKDTSVNNAVQSITNEASRIDVLINNAGYGLMGAFEELPIEEIKAEFDTNIFGLIRTTQAVLPVMGKQNSGFIINISSGAGRFGYPGASAYVSTKFAVEGLTESISYELEPFGIKVILIEPGFIKTNFQQAIIRSQHPDSPYSEMMQKRAAASSQFFQHGSEPELVAKTVLTAINTPPPVGKDVEEWVKSKNSMTDAEFHDMMMKGFAAIGPNAGQTLQ